MPRPVLLAALVAVTSTTVLAQTSTPTPQQSQQLIDRLFRSTFGPAADAQITYGAVPAALPIQLDPRLSVIASLRISAPGNQNVQHRILVTTPLPADETVTVLTRSLEATNWQARPDVDPRPVFGFVSAQTFRLTSFYREGETNFMLDVGVSERGGVTELDLVSVVVPREAVVGFKQMQGLGLAAHSSLPLLKVFPGASIKGTPPVTFPNGSFSSVHLKTDRSAKEVFAFYSAQLKAAGWRARTDATDGPLRVVTYALKDLNGREALGTLGIRPWEKEGGGYVLTVSVQGFKPW